MKAISFTGRKRTIVLGAAVIALFTGAMITPAQGADTNPVVPIALTPPTGLPDIPAIPYTGVKSATFTTPEKMVTLDVTPNQGTVGTPVTVSGKGLPAHVTLPLTWGTFDGTWVTDIQPNSVNYLGTKYTKYNVDMVKVTTDASGAFTFKSKVPSDFGGVHDIYLVQDGVAIAHGGYQITRSLSISPKSGPIGTPITITYTGLGASLYTAGAAVHWDSSYAGSVVGGFRQASSPPPVPVPTSPPRLLVEDYGQTVHLFLAAVAQGMAVADALAAFAQVSRGHVSHDDKCFLPENAVLGPVADRIRILHGAERRVVCGSEGESDVTLFFVDGAIAALVGGSRLRSRWLDAVRRDAGGLESLPDFIALPRDEEGRPIIPTSRVTVLVEAREA